MRPAITLGLALIIAGTGASLSGATTPATPEHARPAKSTQPHQGGKRNTVGDVLGTLAALYRSHDGVAIEEVGLLLEPTVCRINSLGMMTKGRDATIAQYRRELAFMNKEYAKFEMKCDIHHVQNLQNAKVVAAQLTLSGERRDSGEVVKRDYWGTFVLRRNSDRWLVVSIAFVPKWHKAEGLRPTKPSPATE